MKSGELRGAVTGLLASACTELMTAWSVCNRSFKERIQETEEVQGLLANNLQNTAQELTDLDDHIAILKVRPLSLLTIDIVPRKLWRTRNHL